MRPRMVTFAQHVAQGLATGLSRAEAERGARDVLFDANEVAEEGQKAAPRALTSNFGSSSAMPPMPPFGGAGARPQLPPHPTGEGGRPPAAPEPIASRATQSAGDEAAALALQRAFRGFRGRERFAWMVRERARQLKEKQRAKVSVTEATQCRVKKQWW